MIREKLIEKGIGFDKDFRMRGTGEVSRIEALSDAVFGFAITLLVVSLEVPQTFTELTARLWVSAGRESSNDWRLKPARLRRGTEASLKETRGDCDVPAR